jgi:hypothetical protein
MLLVRGSLLALALGLGPELGLSLSREVRPSAWADVLGETFVQG